MEARHSIHSDELMFIVKCCCCPKKGRGEEREGKDVYIQVTIPCYKCWHRLSLSQIRTKRLTARTHTGRLLASLATLPRGLLTWLHGAPRVTSHGLNGASVADAAPRRRHHAGVPAFHSSRCVCAPGRGRGRYARAHSDRTSQRRTFIQDEARRPSAPPSTTSRQEGRPVTPASLLSRRWHRPMTNHSSITVSPTTY